MKTEEDEAFDELAKRQGHWGGGYQAKKAMAADKLQEPPSEWAGIKAILDEYGLQAIDFVADFKAALAQPAQEPQKMIQMVDAAMVEMRNITPPLRRSECERLIHAALSNSPAAQPADNPYGYDWSMLEAAQESLREHMARIKELEAQLAQPAQEPVATVQRINGVTFGYLEKAQPIGTQLYTYPPKREWVGLTDEDADDLFVETQRHMIGAGSREFTRIFTRLINAKLKEQNND